MLKVTIDLLPHGNADSSCVLAEVEIANVTSDPSKGIDARGWLVDWRPKDAVSLLGRVIDEWSSGRPLPIDNHGNQTTPEGMSDVTPNEWWAKHDLRMGEDSCIQESMKT